MGTPPEGGVNTSEKSISQDGTARPPVDHDRNHGTPARTPLSVQAGEQMMGEPPTTEIVPVEDKRKLQDQTNLLPFKQLLVVFLGLSCALFCQSKTTSVRKYIVRKTLTTNHVSPSGSLSDQTM